MVELVNTEFIYICTNLMLISSGAMHCEVVEKVRKQACTLVFFGWYLSPATGVMNGLGSNDPSASTQCKSNW
jgi:hypothetical protein